MNNNPVLNPSKARVRVYRHGLGDCHLLRFIKPDGTPFHVLIDCGVVGRTKSPGPLMSKVVRNIETECNGVLDVVVATHAHTDHLSGFLQAKAVFDRISIKRLWLSWLEEPGHPVAKQIQDQILKKLTAVRLAATKLEPTQSDAHQRIVGLLDFFGPGAAGDDLDAVISWLRGRSVATPEYFEPGTTFMLPEVSNVRVYVLGPPKKLEAYRVMNPRKSRREGYEIAFAAATDGFAAAVIPGQEQTDASFPFDGSYRISPHSARQQNFFVRNYFTSDSEISAECRQIEHDWLEAAEQLALYLDDFTNNTSLALAFEFTDTGDVLLFPGDAQIGSWLTWHALGSFRAEDGSIHPVSIRDLFARVAFYKASHHASHNGTLSGFEDNQTGLEQMSHRDLVCVVPVDREMSRAMKWDRTLPWDPLLKRLKEKSKGRLILTDVNEAAPTVDELPMLSQSQRVKYGQQVVVGKEWIDYFP